MRKNDLNRNNLRKNKSVPILESQLCQMCAWVSRELGEVLGGDNDAECFWHLLAKGREALVGFLSARLHFNGIELFVILIDEVDLS